jgi:hypothetical protein
MDDLLELVLNAIISQINGCHLFLEIITILLHHELLHINIDLVALFAKATDYDEPREPFFFVNIVVRK